MGSEGHTGESDKGFVATLLLSLFLGFFGADRFYLGMRRSGVWKLVTFGGLGYWWLFDIILTIIGRQRDATGLRLQGYEKHKWTAWIVAGSLFAAFTVSRLVSAGWSHFAGTVAESDSRAISPFTLPLAAVFATLALLYRRRRLGRAFLKAKDDSTSHPVPPKIRSHLDKLSAVRQEYVLCAASGTEAAVPFVNQIDALIQNATELFRRLDGNARLSQRARAVTEYDTVLSELAMALDRDYLLDILLKPRFWDDWEERVDGVWGALVAADRQLVDNIRQVNADRGLAFEVSVDGIRYRH